eukprot:CAMPEP_0194541314 /NCGR_PEP_ID=MMETSP0253-20130528/81994_1 /TAXON_ID=2966 /ORGANISM="Noctiluca scintillans" /LENGTH=182 /DNA_ID=CAMNT_0039387787 /DNA_START=51 /DNA_END=599 /DNA_ORIENTATION=+
MLGGLDAPPESGEASGPGGRGPRPRGAVTGGWGFEGGGTPVRMSAEPVSPVGKKKGHFDEDDEGVPTIPDLEEEADEDITRMVAAPPSQATFAQPVRVLRELDVAAVGRGSQLPATPEEGVDLAPLMQCLCPEEQVFEPDSMWDHELIFQEVASAINADCQTVEEEDNEVMTGEQINGAASL